MRLLPIVALLALTGCDSGTLSVDHERRRPEPLSGGPSASASIERLGIGELLRRPGETPHEQAGAGDTAPAISSGPVPGAGLLAELPAGWQRLPAVQFRDLNLAGPDGLIAYVTLLGRGNDLASNITRWQRRLGAAQTPIDAGSLPRQRFLGADGVVVELRGRWSDVNNTTTIEDARLLAIYAETPDGGTATFLAVGPGVVLQRERAAILAIAASVRGNSP
jgi:hypothetical protein